MPSMLILALILEGRNEVCALHRMLASILALEGLRQDNETFPRPKCDGVNENITHKSWINNFDRVVPDHPLGLRTIACEHQ
jgi:hypothetical protein